MEIINLICYGCAVLFFGMVLIFDATVIISSIFYLFAKRKKGELLARLIIVFTSIFLCPWILKIIFFFLLKMGVLV